MADDKMSTSVPMEAVHVTVVGGTGDGSQSQQELITQSGQPNIIATFVPTATALLVRWIDTFLTTFLAISGVGAAISIEAIRNLVPTHAALGGAVMEEAIFYAFITATFGALKDLTVIVGKLKARFPLLDV
jgi:hypothetical protein